MKNLLFSIIFSLSFFSQMVLAQGQIDIDKDVINPRLDLRPGETIVTVWSSDSKSIERFLSENNMAYRYGFVRKDSPEIEATKGRLAIGTPVIRVPFRSKVANKRGLANPLCGLIAQHMTSHKLKGGCIALTVPPKGLF